MATETRTGIKANYECSKCGIDYSEQRQIGESQFFTHCWKLDCQGEYVLLEETEFTYEQELPPIVPVIEEESVSTETIEEPKNP